MEFRKYYLYHWRILGRSSLVSSDFVLIFLGYSKYHRSSAPETFCLTDFLVFISWRRLWESFVRFYLSFTIPFSDKKVAMVRTRSRVTSPGHQESRDASSHPHRDRQSAPAMQPSSVHVQSMATAMAELTRQNQELTREINLRRQRHEAYGEEQDQS